LRFAVRLSRGFLGFRKEEFWFVIPAKAAAIVVPAEAGNHA
jgi:hypothetical protein